MKVLERICPVCTEKFIRKAYEINKVEKTGGRPTCSRKCSAIIANKAKVGKPISKKQHLANTKNALKATEKKLTKWKYPGLNRFLTYARRRNKEFNLTRDYIIKLWENQEGRCAYLGIELTLPNPKGHKVDPRYLASMDRIDSNLGYIQGNVQFVSSCINQMKSTLSHEETLEFLDLIKTGYKVVGL
jgi:hypothetical protein